MVTLKISGCRSYDYASLRLPKALPPSTENPYADSDDAAVFGFHVFYDARFSSDGSKRCATCHAPETYFSDTEKHSFSTPTLFNSAHEKLLFWDGRTDALSKAPLDAFLHEMGADAAFITDRVRRSYLAEYEAVFGPLGSDGSVQVGQALEAYMRKIATGPSRLDRWIDGDKKALSAEEVRGLDEFFAFECVKCHSGPTLSDSQVHVGLPVKTPSLRNVSRTAPYFHDGRLETLEMSVAAHGTSTPELIAFLKALDGDYPLPPWNNWPDK